MVRKFKLFAALPVVGTLLSLQIACSKKEDAKSSSSVTSTSLTGSLLKDINTGVASDVSGSFKKLNNATLYFKSPSGFQLWKATTAGVTTLVKDHTLGNTIGTLYGDDRTTSTSTRLYYTVNQTVWTTDGTTTTKIATLADNTAINAASVIGNDFFYQVASAKVYRSIAGAAAAEIYATGTTSFAAAVAFNPGSATMYMTGNIAATVTTVYSITGTATAATTVKAFAANTTATNRSILGDNMYFQGTAAGADQHKVLKSVAGAAAVAVYSTGTTEFAAAVTFVPGSATMYMYGNAADHEVYGHTGSAASAATNLNPAAGANVGTNATVTVAGVAGDNLYYQVTDTDNDENDLKIFRSLANAAAAEITGIAAAAYTMIPGSATMYLRIAAAASTVFSNAAGATAVTSVRVMGGGLTFGSYAVEGDNLFFQEGTGRVNKSTAGAAAVELYTTGTTAFAVDVAFSVGSTNTYIFTEAGSTVYYIANATATASAVAGTPFIGGTGNLAASKTLMVGDTFFFTGTTTPANGLLASVSGAQAIAVGDFTGNFDDNDQCTSVGVSTVAYGTRIFFNANDGTNGCELWTSDGTTAGTTMVSDVYSGYRHAQPGNMTMVGSRIYFTAIDGSNGTDRFLYASDSPYTSATKITLTGGHTTPDVANMTAVGGVLYFSVDNNVNRVLYAHKASSTLATAAAALTDGTDMYVIDNSVDPSIVALGTTAIIRGADLGTAATNFEIHKSDSTATSLSVAAITEIATGNTSAAPVLSEQIYNGTLFFVANDQAAGAELWKTDGSASGTVMVQNIYEASGSVASSSPTNLTLVGSNLFFTAIDGGSATNDKELWVSPSPFTTAQKLTAYATDSSISSLVAFGSNLAFYASEDGGTNLALYKSDGTVDGTVRMFGEAAIAKWVALHATKSVVNDRLFFIFTNDGDQFAPTAGAELWSTGGTAASTMMHEVNPGSATGISATTSFATLGSSLLFVGTNGTHRSEVWSTNGTTTTMVSNLNPNALSAATAAGLLIQSSNAAYYWVNNVVDGKSLHKFSY